MPHGLTYRLFLLLLIFLSFKISVNAQTSRTDTRGVPKAAPGPRKYVEELKIYVPKTVSDIGLHPYYDYDEALEASRPLQKPVMIDFTGVNGVNCRLMEKKVWADPVVAKILKEDFIVASLYCDMRKIELPINKPYYSDKLKKKVVTLGDKYCDLELAKLGSEWQPIYVFVDGNGKKLVEAGYSYDPDVPKFVAHLEKVKANYKKGH